MNDNMKRAIRLRDLGAALFLLISFGVIVGILVQGYAAAG